MEIYEEFVNRHPLPNELWFLYDGDYYIAQDEHSQGRLDDKNTFHCLVDRSDFDYQLGIETEDNRITVVGKVNADEKLDKAQQLILHDIVKQREKRGYNPF